MESVEGDVGWGGVDKLNDNFRSTFLHGQACLQVAAAICST